MARILVIEDDEAVRRAIRRHLEIDGHEVVEAPDGKAGTRIFRQDPPDLVITDLFMPEKEGLETIRELRRDYKEARILVVTGAQPGGSLDFRDHARMLGAKAALSKPFTREQLLGAVREALDD